MLELVSVAAIDEVGVETVELSALLHRSQSISSDHYG